MDRAIANVEETSISVGDLFDTMLSGLLPGRQTQRRRRRGEPLPTRICLHCQRPFTPKRSRDTLKNRNLYCSRPCASRAPRPNNHFATPPSTAQERVRAQGLINMRVKRGLIEKPHRCDRCGKQKRLDSHHPDYQQPDLVAWVCRSCHMLCHNRPDVEREVAALARRHRPHSASPVSPERRQP